MDVALRRPDGHARNARNLVVGEADGVAQDDDRALVDRQPREPVDEVAPQVREEGEAERVGEREAAPA